MQLDPLNAFNQALYATILYFVRRYDEAIAQYQNALSTSGVANCGLWYAYNMTGKPEPALMAAEGCIGHYSGDIKAVLERGYAAEGYAGAMRRVGDFLAAGIRGVYVAPIDVFLAYAHARQRDSALEWLSKSVDARDPNVYGAVRDPFVIDSLGDDPRFQSILRRTGLPN
jgi:tetratricopeptide (TPR) repeat protein